MEGSAYRDLEVHRLLGEGAHLVVEAEAILAHIVGREDKVALSLLGTVENHLVVGASYCVVDIEGATGLDLQCRLVKTTRA